MLVKLPNTGDWVNPDAVLRVQKTTAPDSPGVHVVTTDGVQMTVPVEGDDAAVTAKRDQIADMINNHRPHHRG